MQRMLQSNSEMKWKQMHWKSRIFMFWKLEEMQCHITCKVAGFDWFDDELREFVSPSLIFLSLIKCPSALFNNNTYEKSK